MEDKEKTAAVDTEERVPTKKLLYTLGLLSMLALDSVTHG